MPGRPNSPSRRHSTVSPSAASTSLKRHIVSAPIVTATRKSGVYHNNETQCAEITARFGRCNNAATAGTPFCQTHIRKPQQHEDDFFDSTFAHVYDKVWIGSLDTTNDPKALCAAGIKTIVNISGWEPRPKTRELYKKLGITYNTLTYRDAMGKIKFLGDEPIKNNADLQNFYNYMDRAVEMIKKAKGPVLDNCHAGINRSASSIAAYLMAVHGMSYSQAEAHLKKANAKRKVPCLTNKHFVAALKQYPAYLAAKKRASTR